MNGWPSFITSVLCSVLRGRLPGSSAFASRDQRVVVAAAMKMMPVLPMTTPVPKPLCRLGSKLTMLRSLSTSAM
jgi:hypothetical protein